MCFGALTAILAIGGLWAGVPLGTLATCVGFCFFQMAQFEGMQGAELGIRIWGLSVYNL